MKYIIIPIERILYTIIVGPFWSILYIVYFLWGFKRVNLPFSRTGNMIGRRLEDGDRIMYSPEYYSNPYTYLFGKPIYKTYNELINIWPWDAVYEI